MTRTLRGGLALLAVAALLGGLTSCARKTVYGEATPRIETTAGRDVVLELPSDPTTGHEWRIGGLPDPRIMALLNADYEAAPSSAPAGSGGYQRWTFRAVGPGTATVRLDYGRPWAAPLKSTTFTVVVR
jgi:inhibitor of cysteine peptidase